ncbi:MAG: MerR family transcriptional regulator [Taibaiella sp.]|jgi:DNA-binding transcriptional MerR regulator
METRVLTLFDDEDFYPKEEPKKKPKKEPVTKTIESENIIQLPEIAQPELQKEIEKQEEHILPGSQIEQEAFHPAEDSISAKEQSEIDATTEIVDETENKLPEEEERIEILAANIEVEQPVEEGIDHSETQEALADEPVIFDEQLSEDNNFDQGTTHDPEAGMKDDNEAEANSADEELNKQILSELVQVDYASLIHRDYPFDMSNASVVDKHATTSKEKSVPEVNDEEEDHEVFEDIVPLPEWKLDKKYYTIGEVAQLFAVNTSHIRFWTNEFKLKPRTTRKGDRLYSPKDIAELRLIHHLVKEKKHTIKGAREKLKGQKNDVHSKLDLKDSLTNLRDTLLKIKEQL